MSRLPLTARILLLILAVQAGLIGALAAGSLDAIRRDLETETRLAADTARALVLATIGTMQSAVPPDRLMALLPDRLVPPRHTRIAVLDARDSIMHQPDIPAEAFVPAPAWFARLVSPPPLETRLPVTIAGRPRGFVYIITDPLIEIASAWRGIRTTLTLAALAALAQAILIWLVTQHALGSVGLVAQRLGDLRRGDLEARVGTVPQPDLAAVAAGVDALACQLQAARTERARLQRRVVTRGDEERKAIARDLHDEMGPCLFGLRVEADALREAAPDPATAEAARAIADIAEEIARVNRALLRDLRPMAVGQLPLSAVLDDFAADLSRRFADLQLDLDIAAGLPEPDEATALTLFRIVQEGTTNALRHADASRVRISLWTDPAHWRITLSDDGRGMSPDRPEGTGLTGMRERIMLLDGRMQLTSGATGTTIAVSLPRTGGMGAGDRAVPDKRMGGREGST